MIWNICTNQLLFKLPIPILPKTCNTTKNEYYIKHYWLTTRSIPMQIRLHMCVCVHGACMSYNNFIGIQTKSTQNTANM